MHRKTLRLAATFVLLPIAAALVGCNGALVGTWRAEPVPKDDVQTITFKNDNTYTAAALEGNQSVRLAGTYDFNGFNLKLKTPGKPERDYKAKVIMFRTLELKKDNKKVTLKKQ